MTVRLDKVPAPAPSPKLPSIWIWLLLCLLCLVLGLGLTLWWDNESLGQQSDRFWLTAVGLPFLAWCLLGCLRAMIYLCEVARAEGWDQAREEDLSQKIRRGRRSQQVLAVSLHTALREPQAQDGQAQLSALLSGKSALRVQPSWEESLVRHSYLSREGVDSPEQLLLRALKMVLTELATTLAELPADRPLTLFLQANSPVSEMDMHDIWQQAWRASGIKQKVTRLDDSGLAAVDRWLDHRIHDQALFLVVALQVGPSLSEEATESVVGLLFGNRLTQNTLAPLAYLHRPEQEREATTEDLDYAVRQALDWASLGAEAVRHVWLSGICPERRAAVATVLSQTSIPVKTGHGLHDIQASLGLPGILAPWLAIASAVDAIRRSGQTHLVLSGEDIADTRVWCTVLVPTSSSST
ncbi:hypothetical protein [Pseudomonas sp. MWU13-2100]|uniref:hypothetical protein n=1 Tax=Pseudomonas sp. MWU13-2100 TaxID=2935075 RepID=UPI00200BE4D2|nr:hypothetical protein [Pseudomonas sp. MWU13-2100]